MVSDAQEEQMGIGVDQQIRHEYRVAEPSDPITAWAAELVAPLATASAEFRDPSGFNDYKIAVLVDDDLVNAFAAPGGYTYITTGLILQASSCGEIAGVLGHELGHVTERHGVKKLEEAFAISIITEWFLGEGLAADAALTIYSFLLSTEFSQEDEAEADSVGLQIAFAAGYNPYGLVDFFQRLLDLTGESSAFAQFFSSHPATEDRIADTSAEIQRRYGDQVVKGQTQTYDCVGTRLSFEQAQQHAASGAIAVIPGTGEGPPAAAAAAATDQGDEG
ncbi:MAG: hypothetical protein CSA66_06295 [Proteobacteria bacterium]|nr:MAG: hypothetical protein CSA66_06295 [Pseudomonadota bacterium]